MPASHSNQIEGIPCLIEQNYIYQVVPGAFLFLIGKERGGKWRLQQHKLPVSQGYCRQIWQEVGLQEANCYSMGDCLQSLPGYKLSVWLLRTTQDLLAISISLRTLFVSKFFSLSCFVEFFFIFCFTFQTIVLKLFYICHLYFCINISFLYRRQIQVQ